MLLFNSSPHGGPPKAATGSVANQASVSGSTTSHAHGHLHGPAH